MPLHTRDRDQQFRRLPTLLAERAAALLQVRARQRTHCRPQRRISSVECTLPSCCEPLHVEVFGRASGGPGGASPEQEPRARSSREMLQG